MTSINRQSYKLIDVGDLVPHPENPNRGDVGAIGESIEANDFFGAVLVQKSSGRIIAGEHRWRAARDAGLSKVPVILADVDDDRALRILLASNQIGRKGRWDESALAGMLQGMSVSADELAGTGFARADLEGLLRTSGELARQATNVLDHALGHEPNTQTDGRSPETATSAEQDPTKPDQPTGGGRDRHDWVQLSWTLTVDARDLVRRAVRRAQDQWGLETGTEALVRLCTEFLSHDTDREG